MLTCYFWNCKILIFEKSQKVIMKTDWNGTFLQEV
jgi:hypothetical protein